MAVLFATSSLGLSKPMARTWVNILVIVTGVMTASLGEIKFVFSGFAFQMGGLLFEAYRLALIQQLLSSQDFGPLDTLFYYAPMCAATTLLLCLSFPGSSRGISWTPVP